MSNLLNAKFVRQYRNSKGTLMFTYKVTGSAEALAEYEKVQGDHFRRDKVTNDVLFFTSRCFGTAGQLIITKNDKVIPDMSEFDMADNIAQQYGGSLGNSIANAMSVNLLAKMSGKIKSVATATGLPAEEKPEDKADLNDDL